MAQILDEAALNLDALEFRPGYPEPKSTEMLVFVSKKTADDAGTFQRQNTVFTRLQAGPGIEACLEYRPGQKGCIK